MLTIRRLGAECLFRFMYEEEYRKCQCHRSECQCERHKRVCDIEHPSEQTASGASGEKEKITIGLDGRVSVLFSSLDEIVMDECFDVSRHDSSTEAHDDRGYDKQRDIVRP